MVDDALTCPNCGSPEVVNIQLPRPHKEGVATQGTQTALRCKVCGTQWTDREQWRAEHPDRHSEDHAEP
jgi:transcription elongation factor Elf1